MPEQNEPVKLNLWAWSHADSNERAARHVAKVRSRNLSVLSAASAVLDNYMRDIGAYDGVKP